MKDLIISLAVDVLVLGSFLAWKFLGIATAGTFFVVLMWIFTGMMVVAVFGAEPRPKRKGFVQFFRWTKGCIVSACIVAAAIYAGLVALAVCYSLAWMLLQTKYSAPQSA
ncbi:TPA: hypothetical protein QDB07_003606 [Burkholderia vietnamiensis]|nr:hypothetical protein [Burkholderia vietnamiensis]